MSSWKGIKVRNDDGRTGSITSDFTGFGFRALTIHVAPGTTEANVQLNATGMDSGETGWEWLCENFSGGARWLPLGDHNPK